MYGEKSMWPLMKIGLKAPEYSLKDIFKFYSGVKFSLKAMWPKIFDVNIYKQVLELKIPVYFCVGRHDYNTPFELVEKFYLKLKAPIKKLIWFENSAHNPNFEEPDKFNELLINEILPESYKNK
jgi:pimeloyl-ACP methyl ester carboxylesterase